MAYCADRRRSSVFVVAVGRLAAGMKKIAGTPAARAGAGAASANGLFAYEPPATPMSVRASVYTRSPSTSSLPAIRFFHVKPTPNVSTLSRMSVDQLEHGSIFALLLRACTVA